MNSPPHTSDPRNAAKSLLAAPMSHSAPVDPRSMRSDPRIPLTDSAGTQATVDSSPQLLDTDTKQPIQPDPAESNPESEAEQQPSNDAIDGDNGNDGHTKEVPSTTHRESQAAPGPSSGSTPVQTTLPRESSPSVSTSHPEPEPKQSHLTVPDTQSQQSTTSEIEISFNIPASPAAPPYFRSQSSAPPTPFVANVPGIWAIQVGKPSASQTDITFEVDQDTAISVRRWATRRDGFDPDSRHVVVSVVALNAAAVSDAQQSVSQSPGGISPQAFALALRDLRPKWPDDGSLVLLVDAGQPGEQSWLTSDMSADKPLDITDVVREGTNSLRIVQLKNMVDVVFAIYAAPPTPEDLDAAREWEKHRGLFSFRQPRSRRLFG
ncbi:hypothetical protein BGW80DRAFT_1316915 [Lactifluus volemus]|nr:hypothetical protein BGW80DRAFT_1316915 [Lactifluus volemus]